MALGEPGRAGEGATAGEALQSAKAIIVQDPATRQRATTSPARSFPSSLWPARAGLAAR